MLLGIDTSGAVSIAVARGALNGPAPEVLAVRTDARARHHDEMLLALIEDTLTQAGITRRDLTGVVVGRGPGPFTGLRVGLVTARTIAAVLGVPLVGLSSLDALAHQALAEHARSTGQTTVGVALDARRREVYHARYRRTADGHVERIADPAVDAPAEVAAELTACDVLVGSAWGVGHIGIEHVSAAAGHRADPVRSYERWASRHQARAGTAVRCSQGPRRGRSAGRRRG